MNRRPMGIIVWFVVFFVVGICVCIMIPPIAFLVGGLVLWRLLRSEHD